MAERVYDVVLRVGMRWSGGGLQPSHNDVEDAVVDALKRYGALTVHVQEGGRFTGSPVYITSVEGEQDA